MVVMAARIPLTLGTFFSLSVARFQGLKKWLKSASVPGRLDSGQMWLNLCMRVNCSVRLIPKTLLIMVLRLNSSADCPCVSFVKNWRPRILSISCKIQKVVCYASMSANLLPMVFKLALRIRQLSVLQDVLRPRIRVRGL